MPKYAYEITETLSKVIVLEADNEDDAYQELKRRYHEGEIVLYIDDFVESDILELTEGVEDMPISVKNYRGEYETPWD